MPIFPIKTLIYLLLVLSLSGCIFMDIKVPLDEDVANTTLGSRIGTSKTRSVLWLFAWGDGSTYKAAKDGEITNITHLDVRYYSILFGLYSSRETIAYGD